MNRRTTILLNILMAMLFLQVGTAQCNSRAGNGKADPTITIGLMAGNERRELLEACLREFVWNHFKGHQTGCIIEKSFSIEGELTKSKLCIKEVAAAWQVEVTIERHTNPRLPWRKVVPKVSYSVVDVRLVPSDNAGSGQPLDFFKKRRLQLIDASGKAITEI